MTSKEFCLLLESKFPYEPTISQQKWFSEVSEFIFLKNSNTIFLLKGYAGTGKTTLIGSLVDQLKYIGYNSVLMAPTGRAAKVMAKGFPDRMQFAPFGPNTVNSSLVMTRP